MEPYLITGAALLILAGVWALGCIIRPEKEIMLEEVILKRYPHLSLDVIWDCYEFYCGQMKANGHKPESYIAWLDNWVKKGE